MARRILRRVPGGARPASSATAEAERPSADEPAPAPRPAQPVANNPLLSWSELSESGQRSVVNQWCSRQWASLREFCTLKGLQYNSIHAAFQVRGIPSASGQVSRQIEQEVRETARQVLQALSQINANVESIQQMLLARVLTGDLTTDDLLKAGAMLSEHAKGASLSAQGVALLMDRLGLQGVDEAEEQRGSTFIPPEVQRQFQGVLAQTAENIVRARQAPAAP